MLLFIFMRGQVGLFVYRLDYAGEDWDVVFAEDVGEVAVNREVKINVLPNLFFLTRTGRALPVHNFISYSRAFNALARNFEFGDVAEFRTIHEFVRQIGEVAGEFVKKLLDAHLLENILKIVIENGFELRE